MIQLITEMSDYQIKLCDKEGLNKLALYYKNRLYVLVFIKQYDKLLMNMRSIDALLSINNVEDSYTIFRKYLETYAIMMSVFENNQVVNKYMIHEAYIGYKACGEKPEEIKTFCAKKPEGHLEYGYLEEVVKPRSSEFRYTMRTVFNAANIEGYYQWYRQCSNFVHNNLSSVKFNLDKGRDKLLEKCKLSFEHFKQLINQIIE